MAGGAVNHFLWHNTDFSPYLNFYRDINRLAEKGSNFVVVDFNLGIDDPEYIKNLKEAIAYAKNMGMRVALTAHSNGIDADSNPVQIVNPDEIWEERWRWFLAQPGMAEVVAENVDILNLLAEPVDINVGGETRRITNTEIAERMARLYRELVRPALGKDIILAVSGAAWAADLRGCDQVPGVPKYLFEVHLYPRGLEQTLAWKRLHKQGIPVIVGEIGYVDDQRGLEMNREWLEYCIQEGIPFAGWGANGMNDARNMFFPNGEATRVGRVIFEAIRRKREVWD